MPAVRPLPSHLNGSETETETETEAETETETETVNRKQKQKRVWPHPMGEWPNLGTDARQVLILCGAGALD